MTKPPCPDPAREEGRKGDLEEALPSHPADEVAGSGSSCRFPPQPGPRRAPSPGCSLHAAGSPLLLAGGSAGMAGHRPGTQVPQTPRANSSQCKHSWPARSPHGARNSRASLSRENPVISRDFRLPSRYGPRLTRFGPAWLCLPPLRSRGALSLYLDSILRQMGVASSSLEHLPCS